MNIVPTIRNQALTANTEASYELPANTTRVIIKLREADIILQVAWVEGESNTNYITIPINSSYSMTMKPRNAVLTLYFISVGSDSNVQIESWQN